MPTLSEEKDLTGPERLPPWFRQDIPDMSKIGSMKKMFRGANLHTVCESSHCPNMGQCWGRGVATFMILGDVCTRACRFCHITAGRPLELNAKEPEDVAFSVKHLRLNYVVITSVARDDLPDEGAGQFAATIRKVKELNPQTKVEVLIPDFSAREECLKAVADAGPEVISHNIETVERLSEKVRPQAAYRRSLKVLEMIKGLDKNIFTKSSLMVGLGESHEEVNDVMRDLLEVDCDILTVGQYLAPSQRRRHLPVERFISPQEFKEFKERGLRMGFKHVMSGPLVRSSYIAEEGYKDCARTLEQKSL